VKNHPSALRKLEGLLEQFEKNGSNPENRIAVRRSRDVFNNLAPKDVPAGFKTEPASARSEDSPAPEQGYNFWMGL